MKFLLALVAAVGLASALPEPVAGGGGDYHPKPTKKCYHTSTCKAVYYTKHKEYTKPIYVDATKTVYKPVTKVTEVPSTYYETKYYTKTKYETKVIHVTKTKNYDITTSKVVCKTYPQTIHTSKTYPAEETKTYPKEYTKTITKTETKEVPKTYTTSKPYPETYKSKSSTVVTKEYTETKQKCWPTEKCEYKKGGW